MTKEQEKAIYRLEMHIKYANLSSDNLAVANKADIETVLNMLKEKDKEIEHYKNKNKALSNQLLMLYKEQDKDNARIEKKNEEIEKKEKIIDLMAEYIFESIDVEEDICNSAYVECKQEIAQDITCIKCIKQYFESKVEKE